MKKKQKQQNSCGCHHLSLILVFFRCWYNFRFHLLDNFLFYFSYIINSRCSFGAEKKILFILCQALEEKKIQTGCEFSSHHLSSSLYMSLFVYIFIYGLCLQRFIQFFKVSFSTMLRSIYFCMCFFSFQRARPHSDSFHHYLVLHKVQILEKSNILLYAVETRVKYQIQDELHSNENGIEN